MTENTLLPCPFCGGQAEQVVIEAENDPNFGGSVIACSGCGASSHIEFGFKEGLVSAWNARAELQERRKADSENLVKDRQRVIDGLCSIGETVWGIEEYMKKWDARYLPKTSSPAPLQGSQPVSDRDELPCTQLPCMRWCCRDFG
ncbi:restriction alleviation protein, Lar family [Salmonella enterica subsp. enterica]|nr:restriction alleviation protein, Lar family [Salmonella enterica subsp. enterica serovar Lagos]